MSRFNRWLSGLSPMRYATLASLAAAVAYLVGAVAIVRALEAEMYWAVISMGVVSVVLLSLLISKAWR